MLYVMAFLCVVGIAGGQIIFKLAAIALKHSESFFVPKTMLIIASAIMLYGVTSLGWIWVLQRIPLGRIYPIMALAFILVPIGSHLVLGEQFQRQYFLGVALIIGGIVIALRS